MEGRQGTIIRIVISIFVVVTLVVFIKRGQDSPTNESSEQKTTTREKETVRGEKLRVIEKWENQGTLRFDFYLHRVYMDRQAWNILNYDMKAGFAYNLSIYVGNRSEDGVYWVDIVDMKDGRIMAKYSNWGFKIY